MLVLSFDEVASELEDEDFRSVRKVETSLARLSLGDEPDTSEPSFCKSVAILLGDPAAPIALVPTAAVEPVPDESAPDPTSPNLMLLIICIMKADMAPDVALDPLVSTEGVVDVVEAVFVEVVA